MASPSVCQVQLLLGSQTGRAELLMPYPTPPCPANFVLKLKVEKSSRCSLTMKLIRVLLQFCRVFLEIWEYFTALEIMKGTEKYHRAVLEQEKKLVQSFGYIHNFQRSQRKPKKLISCRFCWVRGGTKWCCDEV